MRVLIACECSQTVCAEFRGLGVECFSCDIDEEYGGHPEWHIHADVREVMRGHCGFLTQDGATHHVDRWDLVIAHPPCTYLCRAQNHLYDRDRYGDEKVDARIAQREAAIEFFLRFTRLGVPTLIENPIGCMSTIYKRADQCVQPWQFGDSATKATCFWLLGLPKLQIGPCVDPPKPHKYGKSNAMGEFMYKTSCLPYPQRARARSKTFPGIARAIATQYTRYLRYILGVEL